ncbi:MAG TPA: ATP-dependent 6-phosphofructokinase [Candidatus Nitrosotalea sp.]|nr:ATP-dependent 6-phosphofructokinase [Candidatus Nitrosotalea sp.]
MARPRHIGVVTAGGDCPGMNAALRAVVKAAVARHDIRVTGFLDGFAGLMGDRARPLGFDDVSGIVALGGTLLGASNRDDPFRVPTEQPGGPAYVDRSDAVLATAARHGIEALVVVGGDGSLTIARRLEAKGLAVVGIPKTIDNDVPGTDITLGFDSALTIATEAIDRLHTTAASHHRVMVVEVMGRQAGWIALEAGLAAGGDVVLIPEIPFRYDAVAAGILARARRGRRFSIVVIAEGAPCPGGGTVVRQIVAGSPEPVRLGGVGAVVSHALEALVPFEVRYVVLGHVQRGGSPTPFDRILAARFGAAAVSALAEGGSGVMVALRGSRIERARLADLPSEPRCVDPLGERVAAARDIGTVFGDEPPGAVA